MCGIAGEFRFDGRAAEVATVLDMARVLEPRGPDGWGVVGHGPLALAHQRLKIIDLSETGAQPMVDSDLGLTAVFNGIIYNYKQLRDELHAEGYRFFSTSDTEVLLKAFHRWGPSCVEQFKGMFAFAIADRRTGELVLGRDRLGIKPLYVAAGAGRGAVRVVAARAAGRRRAQHRRRPRRAAPLHELPLRGPRAAHDPAGRPEAPAGHGPHDLPRRRHHRLDLLGARVHARRATASAEEWARDGARLAAHRGGAAHGRRRAGRACCSRAASTPRSSSPCSPRWARRTSRRSRSASRPRAASPATSSTTPTSSRRPTAPTT